MGLRLCHAKALDQQPFGAVDQPDLLNPFLYRGLLCLHLAHPLAGGAEDPQVLRHHLHTGRLGQCEHAIADNSGVDVVELIAPHQQEDSRTASGANVHRQMQPEVIRQRRVDQHNIK